MRLQLEKYQDDVFDVFLGKNNYMKLQKGKYQEDTPAKKIFQLASVVVILQMRRKEKIKWFPISPNLMSWLSLENYQEDERETLSIFSWSFSESDIDS